MFSIFLINLFIFIHETGHILGALLFGGYFYSLEYGSVIVLPRDVLSYYTMIIGGPLLSISLAFLLSRYAYKNNKKITFILMNCIIMYELFSWGILPLLGRGDSHLLLCSLGVWYKGCLLNPTNLVVIIPFLSLSFLAFTYVVYSLVKHLKLMKIEHHLILLKSTLFPIIR